uniref:Rho GTPase activating protein 10 n=1 Tax=Pelusios castaneus TaxID=367368 RepID=A0A8C8R922_9SAUR
MGLQPLEFSDCYLDSPWFRERIRAHEAELEKTNKFIKELLKDGKSLIAATKNLSAAQRKFAHSLRDFKFEFIGDAETDDERCIDASLHEFSNFLKNLEEQREILALSVTETLIKPLEKFRKEKLGAVKEEKKKFDKETEKNYTSLEKHLNLSAKKKESHLLEADSQVEQNRKHFYELSLEYVCKLQEIQERKKFECVEPVLSFFQGMFTFYHQGYELSKDFNHYKMALQINIQNTRNRFEGTRSEVEELMNKIRQNPQEHKRANQFTIEGYLYAQEKWPAPFGSSWVKHYCMYRKETKKFTMIPFEHKSGGKIGDGDVFLLTCCTKRNMDTIDRRFCFDIEAADRSVTPVTMQAFSEEDRKLWMEALDGKEAMDKIGFTILRKCISAIETRGINDQGLYRVVGVSSKVQRLLSLLMDAKTCSEIDLENSVDWEVKTITSAMKQYLSGSPESRVNAIHFLVHKLPEKNKEMLDILVKHLANVSDHAKKNLMTVANLGVVFGPTLMRPQEETVAAIMDLKFQNIVVEILIENHEKVRLCVLLDSIINIHRICATPILHSRLTPSLLNQQIGPSPSKPTPRCSPGNFRLARFSSPPLGLASSFTLDCQFNKEMDMHQLYSLSGLTYTLQKFIDYNLILTYFIVCSIFSVLNRRARAVYPCEAEHSSELSFQIGAVFENVEFSREPGWLEGTLNGRRGLIPQNYVQFL